MKPTTVSQPLAIASVLTLGACGDTNLCSNPGVSDTDAAEMCSALQSGDWRRRLGSGEFAETFVYTFTADGSYTNALLTDFDPPDEVGMWLLQRNGADLVLILEPEEGTGHGANGTCHWLGCESNIRYDSVADELIVYGGSYVGEISLRR